MLRNATIHLTDHDGHVQLFTNWLRDFMSEKRSPEEIEPRQLDTYLADFALNAKQYEPSTLSAIHCSLQNYLNDKSYQYNIRTYVLFRHSRDVFAARIKELSRVRKVPKPNSVKELRQVRKGSKPVSVKERRQVRKGSKSNSAKKLRLVRKGSKPHSVKPFTSQQLIPLSELDLLGVDNPEALLNSMWLFNSLHFSLQCHEHAQLLWGDMELKTDEFGTEYIEFHRATSKPRRGVFCPKITLYSKGTDDCPVHIYKEYARRRPTLDPRSPFYLHPLKLLTSDIWFCRLPLSVIYLDNMAKIMAERAVKKTKSRRMLSIRAPFHDSGVCFLPAVNMPTTSFKKPTVYNEDFDTKPSVSLLCDDTSASSRMSCLDVKPDVAATNSNLCSAEWEIQVDSKPQLCILCDKLSLPACDTKLHQRPVIVISQLDMTNMFHLLTDVRTDGLELGKKELVSAATDCHNVEFVHATSTTAEWYPMWCAYNQLWRSGPDEITW